MMIIFFISFVSIFLNQSLSAENTLHTHTIPDGFVDIKEVNPTVLLDMRYYGAHNFVGERIDGYNAYKCILTKQAATALSKVQKELSESSLSLKVYDCYRPQRAVNHFVRWAQDTDDTRTKKEFYPGIDKKNLFRDGYIAEKSSHSRGSTVDVTIVPVPVPQMEHYIPGQRLFDCTLPAGKRFRDNSIDMGTGFDCFNELSHTLNREIGLEQRINRLVLKTLMEKHGFKNLETEWWHYTLKNEPFPDTCFDFVIE